MDSREIRAMMVELAPVVRECVGAAVTPLLARIDTLERGFASLPTPRDGKDADPVLIARLVDEAVARIPPAKDGKDGASIDPMEVKASIKSEVAAAIAALPPAKDGLPGRDADPEAVIALVDDVVSRAVGELPLPKDGKDADLDLVQRMVSDEVAKLPPAKDGKDVDPEAVAALVDDVISRAIDALPRPQDGKSVTVDELRPMVDEAARKAVAAIPAPKDGVGIAGALIDRAGHLAVTMTDGTIRDLGPVVGKDADQAALELMIAEKVAAIPVPKDGKDGRDGLGFEDMSIQHDGARGFVLRFARGDVVKESSFVIPAMIYRGVFAEGSAYTPGDTVTWAGSLWHCHDETSEKPGDGSKFWTLAAKRGRDGKDGEPGKPYIPPAPVKVR